MTYTHAIFRAGYGQTASTIKVPIEDFYRVHKSEPTDRKGYRYKLVKVAGDAGEEWAHISYDDGKPCGLVIGRPVVSFGYAAGPDDFARGGTAAPKDWGDAVKEANEAARALLNMAGGLVAPKEKTPKFKRGDWVYWLYKGQKRFAIVTGGQAAWGGLQIIRSYDMGIPGYPFGGLGEIEMDSAHPANADDAWIPWFGGECPVPREAWVEVKFANGRRFDIQGNGAYWDHRYGDSNIARYRAALPPA